MPTRLGVDDLEGSVAVRDEHSFLVGQSHGPGCLEPPIEAPDRQLVTRRKFPAGGKQSEVLIADDEQLIGLLREKLHPSRVGEIDLQSFAKLEGQAAPSRPAPKDDDGGAGLLAFRFSGVMHEHRDVVAVHGQGRHRRVAEGRQGACGQKVRAVEEVDRPEPAPQHEGSVGDDAEILYPLGQCPLDLQGADDALEPHAVVELEVKHLLVHRAVETPTDHT